MIGFFSREVRKKYWKDQKEPWPIILPVSENIANIARILTHPDDASLVDPLFAYGGKRVNYQFLVSLPSFPLAGERVVQRSVDRVSHGAR